MSAPHPIRACCIYWARYEQLDDVVSAGWIALNDDGRLGWSQTVNHIHAAIFYRSSVVFYVDPALARCARPARHICPDHATSHSYDASDDANIDPLTVESASVAMGIKTRGEAMLESVTAAAMPHPAGPASSSSLRSLSGAFVQHYRCHADGSRMKKPCCAFLLGAAPNDQQ